MPLIYKLESNVGIARRVTLAGGAFLFAVIGLISAVLASMLLRSAQERTVAWMDAKVEAVAEALDAHDQTSKLMVERFFKVFSDQFGKNFALDESAGKLSQLGISLNGYHNPCDKFTEFTGGAATVLMKRGDGFVAISSSLTDQKGERTLDLNIRPNHPAHALLEAGKAYVGRATLFARPYITRMQPVRDLQGRIVGALFVAFELTEFDRALSQTVERARFFESGGVYVLDAHAGGLGGYGVALAAAGAIPDLPATKAAAQSIFEAQKIAGDGAEFRKFQPLLRPADADRFAVARLSKGTGWLVVGEASSNEAGRSQWAALMPFFGLLGVAAVALCWGQYWLIRRWVSRPLAQVTREIGRVASGDLSVAVLPGRDDEIGYMKRGVESMRLRFVELLGSLRQSAQAISSASTEIASGNQDLSQRTEITAARLQETSSAMVEIRRSVEETSTAVHSAGERSGQASLAAQRGGAAVEKVVECMNGIAESSRRITEITSVIDGIAFQTNLLALNAAVEAARAGESGRGFSVVASEVRSLAHRASAASREIKQLLDDSASKVQAGHGLAHSARDGMHDIAASVQGLIEALRTISASSAAQTSRLVEVGESVSTLDAMTQQNAALVEQSAAAAASLEAQAANLVRLMSIFRLSLEVAPASLEGLPSQGRSAYGGVPQTQQLVIEDTDGH